MMEKTIDESAKKIASESVSLMLFIICMSPLKNRSFRIRRKDTNILYR